MAIYIQISGSTYKVPNKIIIGRGAPFDQFNGNRKVGRAHLVLARDKKGLYVKDLGSPEGISVNGVRVKSKKFVPIKANDLIEFAGETMSVLTTAPAAYKTIERFESKQGFWNPVFLMKTLSVLFSLSGIVTSFAGGFHLKILVASVLSGMVFYLFGRLILYFVMKMDHLHFLTSVSYGDQGLTCHYRTGENMTFAYKDITDWSLTFNAYGKILCINAYGQFHRMQLDKGTKPLAQHLLKTLPGKETGNQRLQLILWLISAPLGFLGYALATNWESPEKQLAGQGLLVLFGLACLAAMGSERILDIMTGGKMPLFKQRLGMVVPALTFFYLAYDFRSDAKVVASSRTHLEACTNGQKSACYHVDFRTLYIAGDFARNIEVACTQGIAEACKYVRTRAPASAKK